MDTLKQLISKAEVVSFDIFDTLIVRLYNKPTDLFLHMEISENEAGFSNARVSSELNLRAEAEKEGIHEVTLDQIYENLHVSYRHLKEKEVALEKRMCRANPEMLEIFHEAIRQGKRVFISSDMYLPGDVIEEILRENGFKGYEKLLLSSETMRPKATKEMYQDLIDESGVDADRILHIGDNHLTDYQYALDSGIQAYWYSPVTHTCGDRLNSAYFACLNRHADDDLSASILKGMLALDAWKDQSNYWEQFGYKYIGILTYGYVRWLKERFEKEGMDKAFFMLRDGYIIKKAFDYLYPEFDTKEIYGSRRMFLFAGMERYDQIRTHITGLHTEGVTVGQLWKSLSIDDEALERAFHKAFPDDTVMVSEISEQIDRFMEDHFAGLERVSKAERDVIESYFEQIGLGRGKAAIVDLGWKGSMLKGITGIYKRAGKKANITGYYIGTHSCDTSNLRIESYLLDHQKSTGAENSSALLSYGYVIPILELAFSAPHPSILKLALTASGIEPVYQKAHGPEKRRMEICEQILSGVMRFISEIEDIQKAGRFEISKTTALAPMEYFAEHVSKQDEFEISKVSMYAGIGDAGNSRPILKQGIPVIGIVNPWPGDMSAESEVITRMKRGASEIGARMVVVDGFGTVLDENQCKTNQFVNPDDLSFVISTHYETAKTVDAFTYHVVWNPPEIPLGLEYYAERVTDQYVMNDDFLIYDYGGMSNHLRSMLMRKPRTLEGASMLTASFPRSAMLKPKLEDPKMFYCGMNWESVTGEKSRHGGLFRLLDNSGKVKFFGPEQVEAWGGIRPWDGYKCYQYSIPFDGFSIVKEINECGVCLVLSSDIHRRAAAATNRVYEACAAGAVIISDDNEFMLRNFKDAALFITYNKSDPQDTFNQVMERYNWIIDHPEEALQIARNAQKVFSEKFSLDIQLQNVIERHANRVQQIREDLFAKDTQKKVLVLYVLNTQTIDDAQRRLEVVFRNTMRQHYPNIELAIATDLSIAGPIKAYCSRVCASATVVPMGLFDYKHSRRMTDGQAIRAMQNQIESDYFILTTSREIWFSDHITTLVRSLEDADGVCAYAGMFAEDWAKYRRTWMYEPVKKEYAYDDIIDNCKLTSPGQFLFSTLANQYMPDFLFDCLDGRELFAYINVLYYREKLPLIFSDRMTFGFYQDEPEDVGHVMELHRQRRFIQDLVKFNLPEMQTIVSNTVTATDSSASSTTAPVPVMPTNIKENMSDMFAYMPLKLLIKLRYHQAWMHKLSKDSKSYKKHAQKHGILLRQLHDYWK